MQGRLAITRGGPVRSGLRGTFSSGKGNFCMRTPGRGKGMGGRLQCVNHCVHQPTVKLGQVRRCSKRSISFTCESGMRNEGGVRAVSMRRFVSQLVHRVPSRRFGVVHRCNVCTHHVGALYGGLLGR